jgi:PAS domain S-box-containing protein
VGRATLQGRLTILFGGIIVGVVLLVTILLGIRGEAVLVEQARMTGLALARGLAATTLNDFLNYNYVALEQKARETVRDPQVAYVVLYDKEGAVASFSGSERAGPEDTPASLSPELLSRPDPVAAEGLIFGARDPGLDVVVPVLLPGTMQRWGTVRLGLKLDAIFSQVRRIRWFLFLLGLAGILAGALASLLFTRGITVPLGELVRAAGRVAGGDYRPRLLVRTGDEVEDLANGFNRMVEKLEEQRSSLMDNLAEIRMLKQFSDLVLLSITNGLFTMGMDGRILTFNRKAEEVLGLPAERALGCTPEEILGGEDPLVLRLREVGEAGSGGESEVTLAVEGEERVLRLSLTPLRGEEGERVGMVCLFQDLTEERALEQKVRRADRLAALGTLAAGLAHEIRNPLAAVRAFVQIAPEKFESSSFREKFNRTVPRELDRVNGLLENLLDLVRKPRLQMVHLELGKAVDQALDLLEMEIQRRCIKVVRRIEEGSAARADASHLGRVLHNLMLNAVQAMPAGGTLTVEASVEPKGAGARLFVRVRIADTGVGIPRENLKDLFNPFFTNKEKGTGLGLAVTHKILEDMGGDISVESERGGGSSFTFHLPHSPRS